MSRLGRRKPYTFSASPRNDDAQLVLAELAKLPERERSKTLWFWAAGYLRGQARQPTSAGVGAGAEEAVLDAIADLLGAL